MSTNSKVTVYFTNQNLPAETEVFASYSSALHWAKSRYRNGYAKVDAKETRVYPSHFIAKIVITPTDEPTTKVSGDSSEA